MDRGNDSFALLGQVLEQKDDLQSCSRIESSCRLIKEDNTRIGDELHSDGGSFALSTTDTLDECVSHFHISTAHQAQFADQILYDLVFFLLGLVDT